MSFLILNPDDLRHNFQPLQDEDFVLLCVKGMENRHDQKRWIKDNDHLSNILNSQKVFMTFKKAEYAIQAEQNRQQDSDVLADHLDFPRFLIMLADA
jgi:hypothetical protein